MPSANIDLKLSESAWIYGWASSYIISYANVSKRPCLMKQTHTKTGSDKQKYPLAVWCHGVLGSRKYSIIIFIPSNVLRSCRMTYSLSHSYFACHFSLRLLPICFHFFCCVQFYLVLLQLEFPLKWNCVARNSSVAGCCCVSSATIFIALESSQQDEPICGFTYSYFNDTENVEQRKVNVRLT